MKPKHQRLTLIIISVVSIAFAAWLIMSSLKDNIEYFFTPSQVLTKDIKLSKKIRVGGLVKAGSIERSENELNVKFVITDKENELIILYSGLMPNLFREGQGIIAVGKFNDKTEFVAEKLLAKHDENYMPPALHEKLKESESL